MHAEECCCSGLRVVLELDADGGGKGAKCDWTVIRCQGWDQDQGGCWSSFPAVECYLHSSRGCSQCHYVVLVAVLVVHQGWSQQADLIGQQ